MDRRAGRRVTALVALVQIALALSIGSAQQPIAPGVTHEQRVEAEGPWVIDVLRISRTADRVRLVPTLSQGLVRGTATIPAQLPPSTESERPVAAVNGDFFAMVGEDQGTPRGAHIAGSELVRSGVGGPAVVIGSDGRLAITEVGFQGVVTRADGSAFALIGVNQEIPDPGLVLYTPAYGGRSRQVEGPTALATTDGLPLRTDGVLMARVVRLAYGPVELPPGHIAVTGLGAGQEFLRAVAEGEEIRVSVHSPGLPRWATDAISGGPRLLIDGRIVVDDQVRHPRTAIGYNDREAVIVTVDGRQPGWSVGMTLTELAQLMLRLGCTDAVNLDGGGSTTAWVRGRVSNRPSDGSLRPVSNGLAVVLRGPIGPPAQIGIDPPEIWALPGATAKLALEVVDADYNPLPEAAKQAAVTPDATVVVQATADSLTVSDALGDGEVEVVAGQVRARLPVHVVAAPTAAQLLPPIALAMPGDTVRFSLSLLAEGDHSLAVPSDLRLGFACPGTLGSVDGEGVLTVAPGARSDRITATAAGVTGEAAVWVAQPHVLDGDTAVEPFRFTAFPPDVPTGGLRLVSDADATGGACLALGFDLGKDERTRAAYARADAQVGRAIGFTARLKPLGCAPWVRIAYVDGNGTRNTVTLVERADWAGAFRSARVRLPDGTKAPVVFESIYAVETDPARDTSGTLYIDEVSAWVIEETA